MLLAPGVDAEHPEEDEHVERDGQRDQREDHPTVSTNPEESSVVDAVVLELGQCFFYLPPCGLLLNQVTAGLRR